MLRNHNERAAPRPSRWHRKILEVELGNMWSQYWSILLLNKLQTWTWTLIEGNCHKRGLAAKRENGGRNVYGYISSCSGFASVYPSAFAAWFAAFWTSVEIVAIFFCEANQIHCHKASLQSDWCTTIVARRYKSMILRSPDPYTDAKGRGPPDYSCWWLPFISKSEWHFVFTQTGSVCAHLLETVYGICCYTILYHASTFSTCNIHVTCMLNIKVHSCNMHVESP